MESCDICYENRPSIKFFYLSCCRVNKLCFYCFEKLPSPICPFCRETIPMMAPKKKKKKSPPPLYEELHSLSSSRIERKQQRRLLKRQLHEDDQIRNRMRSFSI